MDERVLKALAVLFLALAIGAVFGSVQATSRASVIQGPSSLLVTPGGEVWLGVDRELWRVSREGALRDTQPIEATGLPGAPANLAHGPGGSVVASVRGEPVLYVLDASTARVTRRLLPQWPDELRRHGGRAINFAFDARGRLAVATGGGHAVALFDAEGRFLARTHADTYRFTNGLWWSEQGLWTTDTNRFTLRRLDTDTLAERQVVDLGSSAQGSYLGPARAHPRTGGAAPMAALVRFHDDMVDGGVSLVAADGHAVELPQSGALQPRDLDWLGDELLVSDGASFSILRWSSQGRALAPFGDPDLQARLRSLAQERDALRAQHVRWLIAAGGCVLLGIACAAAAPRLARRRRPAAPALDLSRLGTPRAARRTLWRLGLKAQGTVVLWTLPLLLIANLPRSWVEPLVGASWVTRVQLGAMAVLVALVTAMMPRVLRRARQQARSPEYEPLLNQPALRLLTRHAQTVAQQLAPGEHVLETFHLRPGLSWWVLTNRRLLGFKASLFEPRLNESHELADVATASAPDAGSVPPAGWRERLFAASSGRLEIALARDGKKVAGHAGSQVLAGRVAERIASLALSRRTERPRQDAPRVDAGSAGRRWRRALASTLVPGLGQWQQGRGGVAIVFLTAWALALLFVSGPALWTLVEPYTDVSPRMAVVIAVGHLALALAAAFDAWFGD